MRITRLLFLLFPLMMAAATVSAAERQPLTLTKADGATVTFAVELAVTPEERATGLMYRRSMDADDGMLFDFGSERPVAMWMRNTYIPLDMLFIGDDKTVKHIAARTTPLSERTIGPAAPVRFVLEINAGLARKLGLAPGDTVSGPAIDDL